jgi:putative FmdB family regulatory protein
LAKLNEAMPIYEYRCDQGHTFEVMQRMTDDPVISCQTCAAPVSRVFHPVAVHFKGSGFYNTDYGTRKRAREKADSGEGSSTKTSESGSSKSESGSGKSEGSSSSKSSEGSKKSEPTSAKSGSDS